MSWDPNDRIPHVDSLRDRVIEEMEDDDWYRHYREWIERGDWVEDADAGLDDFDAWRQLHEQTVIDTECERRRDP